jgi:hypothetical protein
MSEKQPTYLDELEKAAEAMRVAVEDLMRVTLLAMSMVEKEEDDDE